jgi:signal transduction histidine kinase
VTEPADSLKFKLWTLDPRRSLVAGAMWLIIALVLVFSIVAALWVGSIARETVFEQHVRRLRLETDQLSAELGLALAARVDAVRAVTSLLRAPRSDAEPDLGVLFRTLITDYPQLDWLAVSDSAGRVVASMSELRDGTDVGKTPWFTAAVREPWLGMIEPLAIPAVPSRAALPSGAGVSTVLGDLALPVRDVSGRLLGVIATRASWRRPLGHFQRLTDDIDPRTTTEAIVLDRDGRVLVGPSDLRGMPWNGMALDPGAHATDLAPEFQRMPDGRRLLVSRAPVGGDGQLASLGWQVQLGEPNARVYQRADAVASRILWISLGLGAITAALGVQGARQITRRLQRLTQSVAQVGEDESARIEVPPGVDEVARLGAAFDKILNELQEERRELERRVAVRTREVERLADESRYAAIVRERLKIARDLHDTLAHSMMAMLSEIRLLRRLNARDPAALAEELQRAENVAREGLGEARKAISQMRSSAVRETGLGPALAAAFSHFIDRTGLAGEFHTDPEAARFGDERGETYLRIAQEALRNVERHAQATQIDMQLRIVAGSRLELTIRDNGVGFDPARIPPGHFGILGLREQAELIGAELLIDSQPQQGTCIVLAANLAPVTFVRTASATSA